MINWIRALDRLLKGEATGGEALAAGRIDVPVGGMTALLVLLGAGYGACMGTFAVLARWHSAHRSAGFLQVGYSAAKVPLLFLLTLFVTLPSLYVFNALVGCRLSFTTVVRLLVGALGVLLAVLASFGSITLFFSLCTNSYSFMVLLNVVMFAIAGLLGVRFLLQTLHRIAAIMAVRESGEQTIDAVPPQPAQTEFAPSPLPIVKHSERPGMGRQVRIMFHIWVIVFALVGAQMGWILRPFIGAPNAPVTFFRSREGNFFQAVSDKVMDLTLGSAGARYTGGRPSGEGR